MVKNARTTISEMLTDGFAEKVRTMLSVMQSIDNSVYYTGTDIAYELVVRNFGKLDAIKHSDFVFITQRVNSSLLSQLKTNEDLHRSTTKITSVKVAKLLVNVRKSYGYRIGKEVKAVKDTVAMKLDLGKYVLEKLPELETDQLLEINNQLNALLTKRFNSLNRKIKELHSI